MMGESEHNPSSKVPTEVPTKEKVMIVADHQNPSSPEVDAGGPLQV